MIFQWCVLLQQMICSKLGGRGWIFWTYRRLRSQNARIIGANVDDCDWRTFMNGIKEFVIEKNCCRFVEEAMVLDCLNWHHSSRGMVVNVRRLRIDKFSSMIHEIPGTAKDISLGRTMIDVHVLNHFPRNVYRVLNAQVEVRLYIKCECLDISGWGSKGEDIYFPLVGGGFWILSRAQVGESTNF